MATSSSKATILFIQPRGVDQEALATAVELRNLRDSLLRELHGDRLDWQVLPAARIEDLAWGLRRYQPAIIHFAGHGSRYGELYLDASDDKSSQPLSAKNLAETLRVYQAGARQPVRLVVLAGCDTDRAAESAAPHVHCAIGMSDKVGDEAVAQHFTPSLYAALADGRSVQNAVDTAVAELRNQGYDEDADIVRVFPASGVDPAKLVLTDLVWQPLSDLHLDYLRSWFGKDWAVVHLADMLPNHVEEVSLLDIYVPLPVTFWLTIRTENQRIVDWWVKQERGKEATNQLEQIEHTLSRLPDEAGMDRSHQLSKLRSWSELDVGEDALQQVVDEIQVKISRRVDQDQPTEDGEHSWHMEAHDAASVQPRFVLLGDPGSGKSSFLRHLALCLAGEMRHRAGDADTPANANLAALRDWLLDTFTPIYIELRDLVTKSFPSLPHNAKEDAVSPSTEDFWGYVRAHLLKGLGNFETDLRVLAGDGTAILLLDGLDEVPDAANPHRRKQIKDLVAALTRTYPALRIIVTARPHAYRLDQWALNGFGHTMLEPLSLSRLHELAVALFGRVSPGQAQEEAKAFINALEQDRKAGRIEESFYATPMFFTMLAALWLERPERQLPVGKAALYRASVDLLLGRYTRRRTPHTSVAINLGVEDPQELRAVLECLACTVHEQSKPGQDTTIFHIKELLGILAEAGYNMPLQDVAAYLEQHAGLLVSPKAQHFYFSHRGFQEHLAASELTCEAPEKRRPAISEERCFPNGLIERVRTSPALWENVARLAAEDLLGGKRTLDGWQLLSALCVPYVDADEMPQAATVALDIAAGLKLFNQEISRRDRRFTDFEILRQAAEHAVVDYVAFATPEQRDIAGQLLGSGPFPGHDPRPGVGVKNGLPDIDWVPISDDGSWTYQSKTHKALDTYWIARYPITYAQFEVFLRAEDGYQEDRWWRGLDAPEDHRSSAGSQAFEHWNHPRERVSWWDAMAFCAWLTARAHDPPGLLPKDALCTGNWQITLPTEQQWEKAARGRDGRQYPWGGDEYKPGYANIDETIHKVGPHYLQKTTAVGMYPQGVSPYGVADLSGNVWEWCLNEYESGKTDPGGDATRVLRGGSWNFNPNLAAAPFRFHSHPVNRLYHSGFRVVVVGCVPVA